MARNYRSLQMHRIPYTDLTESQVANHRWETGRIEARYVKSKGQWKIAALDYQAAGVLS
jgi:hypothetical protein